MRTKLILAERLRPGDLITPDALSKKPARLVISVRLAGPRVEFSWLWSDSGVFNSGWTHADWRVEVLR